MPLYDLAPIPPLRDPDLQFARLDKVRNLYAQPLELGASTSTPDGGGTADPTFFVKIQINGEEAGLQLLAIDSRVLIEDPVIAEGLAITPRTGETDSSGNQVYQIALPADLVGQDINDVLEITPLPDGSTVVTRKDGFFGSVTIGADRFFDVLTDYIEILDEAPITLIDSGLDDSEGNTIEEVELSEDTENYVDELLSFF
jgi:hypothetical protein